jgi:N-acetylglucosaminyldiphosphoundecaprenol N-acetyl-beta-D-mannosaminyltransferase
MRILGTEIDNLEYPEILDDINSFLNEDGFHQIATVNPEFVMLSQKDQEFGSIVNSCHLKVADGKGIDIAARIRGERLKFRITGVDLADKIMEIAEKDKLGVYLACRKNGLSTYTEVKTILENKYPSIRFSGADIDHIRPDFGIPIDKFDILFCNFGAPWQEKFIFRQKNARIRLAMGVGGTFDFWCGKISRAPLWMRKFGFEWVWRLTQQPKRFPRIFRSAVIFPLKVILSK